MRLPNQEVETDLKVGFSPLKETIENYPKEHSIVGARLEFRLVFDTYVLSGSVSQINHILNRKIEGQNDVTQEEVDELVAPLFDIVRRMSYEVPHDNQQKELPFLPAFLHTIRQNPGMHFSFFQ